jgi:hypothetical protein
VKAAVGMAFLLWAAALSAEPIVGDGQAIELVPEQGVAIYRNCFDQPADFVQHCFAVEGTPTWRREKWEDLVVPPGGAVIYKFVASAPLTSVVLRFSSWVGGDRDVRVFVSADGRRWHSVFACESGRMGRGQRIYVARPLQGHLPKESREFYIKFAAVEAPMILYDFSLRATVKPVEAEAHGGEYAPGRVPSAGRLRYVIHYGEPTAELMDFVYEAWINLLHWHGPFAGYWGLPDHEALPAVLESCRETVRQAHENGAMILFYVGPVFSYGDPEKRTQLFAMYDKQWEQYAKYLGPRPPQDPLEWTQRDAEGQPRPYVWEGNRGYYLCTNSPAVRQYDKGLLRLISATGADGVFYDGPAFAGGLCYCADCVAGFRRYLGSQFSAAARRALFGTDEVAALEPPKRPGTPLWVAWRRFHALALQDFLHDTRQAIRAFNPNFIMTANYCMWEGDPYGALRGASEDVELWSQVLDVVFEEGCFEKSPRTAGGIKYSNAANYKYLLAAAHGKPVAELAYMCKGNREEAQGNLARLAVAEGLMAACAWQVPYGQTNSAGRKAIAEYHAFQKAHQDWLVGQVPYTNIGVLASLTQGYCEQASFPMAISRFLTDHHIDHRMVIDAELASGPPAGLEVLIVPQAPCLSAVQVKNLLAFARKHRLVLVGACGTHDEWGRPAPVPLAQRLAGLGEKVVQLPAVGLPAVARRGVPAEAAEALAPLLEVCAAAPPLVSLVADGGVEFAAYRLPNHRFTVHLVNFDVDLDGQVKDKEDLGLRFRLPPGYTPVAVELRSPDYPPAKLDCKLSSAGRSEEVVVRIPRLHIYSLVLIRAKQKKHSAAVG